MAVGTSDYIRLLTAYNTWANGKILKFTETAGEHRATSIQKSSFPSIRETILHILDAQTLWLNRLNGNSPGKWPEHQFKDTAVAACELLVESSRNFEAFVGKFSDVDLQREVIYLNIKGDEFRNTVLQIVAHVMNHGTFHRGQLVTIFRGAGFTGLSSTDMITFFREQH